MYREIWKEVNLNLDFKPTKPFRLEVSNWGRIRTFNSLNDGTILKCGLVEGYRIYRALVYKPREEQKQKRFDYWKKQINALQNKRKELIQEQASKTKLMEVDELLKKMKTKLSTETKKDTKNRIVRFQKLVHRLVAETFLPKPKENQKFVAHIDFDKENNRYTNLKWTTLEENVKHNLKNPKNLQKKYVGYSKHNAKLTETKVMYIKKMLNEGKTLKAVAKNFKVSDMQIHRIKTGENWTNVSAAN